ncbi:MAG: response regulator [Lachnospiraceae bacterium]|jgi:two-component system response regulator YesN|nr:response regulator [Lachnospiraceae bacterium]
MDRKIRVMLIDDEESARKLLRAGIKWEDLNMEVVGEAASGIEAINVIDDYRPDIAFVDISMPFMNGIEFTEVVTERYPHLIIIIMTAFNEFEFARKCVSLSVFDYMLKPMVRAEITKVLERAGDRLRREPDHWDEVRPESEAGASDESQPMESIRRYVEQNFTDPRLNLAFVAQQFGFSASYLSRKFKQGTGKNFVEYLTELRMEKALSLAASHEKMFCAAAEVGIPDPNYFSRCFKKYTGKSYSEVAKEAN